MELVQVFTNLEGIKRAMNRTLLLIGILVLGAFRLWGQSHMVSGSIANAEKGLVYLATFYGDRYSAVDSIQTTHMDFCP